jgi:hypothetical protein
MFIGLSRSAGVEGTPIRHDGGYDLESLRPAMPTERCLSVQRSALRRPRRTGNWSPGCGRGAIFRR